jgi:hypothetical protein
MDNYQQFDEALRSEEPMWRLRELVQDMLTHGQDRNEILARLESYRSVLREAGRDDEDVVMEVMDFLTGWCSPHMRL